MSHGKLIGAVLIAAALVLPATTRAATSGTAQASIISGSSNMPSSEIASLVGATNWTASVEGGSATRSTTSLHCYGKVYWKAAISTAGITVWKEWNHTAWCGVPGSHIKDGSVNGHTDTYTSVSWNAGDESWRKWTDQRHPTNARYTQGHAHFSQCAGPVCVTSEDINTTMHIFADGTWKGW